MKLTLQAEIPNGKKFQIAREIPEETLLRDYWPNELVQLVIEGMTTELLGRVPRPECYDD